MTDKNYIFYQGWSRYSINMEKFLRKYNVPFETIHQDIGERAKIFSPNNRTHYEESDFWKLKIEIIEEKVE